MKICLLRFNLVLLIALVATGCETLGKKKEVSTIALHIELSDRDPTDRSQRVEIGRDGLFTLNVDKTAFLTEGHVLQASVMKAMGTFEILLKLNRQGTWILEQYSTASRGRHAAIYCTFGESRWIAAPTLNKTIKNGELIFTPDATLDEAQRIVRGLNEVAKVVQKNNP